MKIPTARRAAAITAAASAVLLPALAAPVTAAPAAADPDCRTIAHGAWIETVCGIYPTKDQCEAARATRGPLLYTPEPGSRSALIGKPGTLKLTCIGPDGGSSSTTSVLGTSDGQWHLSHIGP
ncbi:hypothetical protein AXK57_22015 [Tsukamurella pulmonis]|uniref:hypothetical protein n=1 Tax=Tsukamurella pulmonis TaxID=47312 RepID=UPI00079ADE77|nr:hypothetical protein [Tsukamurella pulmonis]KXP11552.1 hypothetical protein AXK57_22015 [Tsukamurella pulmonis]